MLQFIFGRAASGKTATVHEMIEKEIDAGEKDVILLVPEQYSFETEKEMLKRLGGGFMSMVQVFSFTRLCETAGRLYGGVAGIRISDAERLMLMGRAVKRLSPHLKLFAKYAGSPVFIRQMTGVIGEMKTAGVGCDRLMAAAGEVKVPALSEKLNEISMIYAAYDDLLRGVYIDPLDELEIFFQKASEHGFFAGKTVYIDAFKGFTGAQLNIVRLMLRTCKRVVISLCCEPGEDRFEGAGVFSNIQTAALGLAHYAAENHIPVEEPVVLAASHFAVGELKTMERLLAGDAAERYEKDAPAVTVGGFETPQQELSYVFKTIHRLVRTEGYRYGDFVIIARDITKYERCLEQAAQTFEVPCFLDRRRGLIASPVARFVLSMLRAAGGFDSNAVFSLLKTGFFGFSTEEIARLEEYVYIWEIDRGDWLEEWKMDPRGFVSEEGAPSENIQTGLDELNRLRKRVTGPLMRLKSAFSDGAAGISAMIYEQLTALKVDRAVQTYCEGLLAENDAKNADFVIESWDLVMDALDSMVRCFGNEAISAAEYTDMLELCFSGASVGAIPAMLDEVSCGSADRIRPARPRAVFVIGLNQGEFPARAEDSGLLLKSDRVRLEELGIEISDHFRRFAVDESFLVYSALCCAGERVYALSHRYEPDGTPCEESPVLTRLREHFPHAQAAYPLTDELPETAAEGFRQLAERYSRKDGYTAALRDYFAGRQDYTFRTEALKRTAERPVRRLSEETCDRLFGRDLYLSASKIETYRKCAFSYYCKYVLKISRLQKAELDRLQRGTLVHFVLEQVLRFFGAEMKNAGKEEIDRQIDLSMRRYLESIHGSQYLDKPRFRFLYGEIAKMLRFLLYHIAREFANSDFVPAAFELNISDDGDIPALKLTFSPGKQAVVTGKIDRVDLLHDPDSGDYVRVVDYKTGKKGFYLSDVLYGLNLQMLLYLHILRQTDHPNYSGLSPAGILYMPSNRGLIGKKGEDPLTMNGMLLCDDAVLTAMDRDNEGCFVPKKPQKDRAENPMIAGEDFETVFGYVDRMVRDTALRISTGVFDLNPRDGKESEACQYCDFACVCGLEEDAARACSAPMTNAQILEKMREEQQDENALD